MQKEDLYGNWEGVSLNDEPLDQHGFTSIRMQITPDSIQVVTQMKTFGDITTESRGIWKLKDQVFISKIGDHKKQSHIKIDGDSLTFSPDPLFKLETVFKSEYKKIH